METVDGRIDGIFDSVMEGTVDEGLEESSVLSTVGALVSFAKGEGTYDELSVCLLYTSPSPRDGLLSRMPSSA